MTTATDSTSIGVQPVTCEQCERPVKARGLCATHYARQRRTGDPTRTRKPGRKPSEHRAMVQAILGPDTFSPRTFSRFYSAQRTLLELGGSAEALAANTAATRPNGSLNIAEYERQAVACVIRHLYDEETP